MSFGNATCTKLLRGILGASLVVLAGGCGGGGGGTTAAGGGTTTVASSGTMTKGSVILNGVRFTAAAGAAIRIDDNPNRAEAELRDGMKVRVKGLLNLDRVSGEFQKVEAEPEVRGQMGGKGLDDFTVRGRHVITDDRTKFEDRALDNSFAAIGFNDLADLDEVEIHGGADDLGNVRATRVERRHDNPNDEVKGVVTALSGTLLSIGSFTIDIAGAAFSPAGASIADIVVGKTVVEVHLTAGGAAARVDIEDKEDVEFEAAEGQEFEVEGFVSGFTAHPGFFRVGNDNVQTTASTRFEGGVAGELMNGILVEAEGHRLGGVLVADKIRFKDSVRIEANADANGSAGALGKTVKSSSGTQLANLPGGIAGILAGDGLRIRGFLNGDNTTITATRVEKLSNPVQATQIILQGVVSAFNGTARTMTVAGLAVDASGAGVEFANINETPVTGPQFFSLLTAGRTIVKSRGSFAAGTLTANRAEIEAP